MQIPHILSSTQTYFLALPVPTTFPNTEQGGWRVWRWEINIKIMYLSIKHGLMRTWTYTAGSSFKEGDSAPQIRTFKSLIVQLKLITLCFCYLAHWLIWMNIAWPSQWIQELRNYGGREPLISVTDKTAFSFISLWSHFPVVRKAECPTLLLSWGSLYLISYMQTALSP